MELNKSRQKNNIQKSRTTPAVHSSELFLWNPLNEQFNWISKLKAEKSNTSREINLKQFFSVSTSIEVRHFTFLSFLFSTRIYGIRSVDAVLIWTFSYYTI